MLKDRKGGGLVWQVGDPAVVFLDEPSSGMDPLTRRAMWNLITNAVIKKNMSVVLTTHNMEECEALCNRIGIMVAGSLVCLGSIQQIKSCFGSGTYTLFFLLSLPLISLLEMETLKKQLILQYLAAGYTGVQQTHIELHNSSEHRLTSFGDVG